MPVGASYFDDSLDGIVAAWPASGAHWALFDGVPGEDGGDGIELVDGTPGDPGVTAPGYTAPAFAPADFAAASGNAKTVAAPIDFGTSTDAYTELGTHWAIVDSLGALVYWDDLPEADVVEVNASDTAVTISPTLYFGGA